MERPGSSSTYRKPAERECSEDNTKDLRETAGNNEKCGFQDSKAKGTKNQRVLHADTSDKAAKRGPEEECESLWVCESLPESTEIHECTDRVRTIEPKTHWYHLKTFVSDPVWLGLMRLMTMIFSSSVKNLAVVGESGNKAAKRKHEPRVRPEMMIM
jgi:hypothetical protein